jgi:23S rRNA (cytidine2498-2'-O)-methyltransferase
MNLKNKNLICFSCSPNFEQYALNEIHKFDPLVRLETTIPPDTYLLSLSTTFQKLTAYFAEKPPIFIRHICPLIQEISPNKNFDLQFRISKDQTFALQEIGPRNQTLKQNLANYLIQKNFILNVKNPDQIISIINLKNKNYLGLSSATENLSHWVKGAPHFAVEKEQISRSEFKLLEIIDLLKLKLRPHSLALDIGAAPGGWTRILLKNQLLVTAVDPAKLNPALAKEKNLTHFQESIQNYLNHPSPQFDLIVNDLKMDAAKSAYLMYLAAKNLKKSSYAIMTLKLPQKDITKKIKKTFEILANTYKIITARQLFHNRHEITVVLQKK